MTQPKNREANLKFINKLDMLDSYETIITAARKTINEALIDLAYIHFLNPHTSIRSAGYACTPAILKVSTDMKLVLPKEPSDLQFVNNSPAYAEEQQQLTKELLQQLNAKGQIDIINRFGNSNQHALAEKVKSKMEEALKILLSAAQLARKINQEAVKARDNTKEAKA